MFGALASISWVKWKCLLTNLCALKNYKLVKDVKRDIAFLRAELKSINAFLEKLSTVEKLEAHQKILRDNICELSYDIEDCIDLSIHQLKRGDARASLAREMEREIKKLWSRYKLGNIIEELKARIKEESHRRLRYNLDEYVANKCATVHIDPRLPALYEEANRLVGIDGPREKIIEWLQHDGSTKLLKVVSIVGFGGLGKTTLANQVLNEVKGHFPCTGFVPVSRSPNIKKIFTDMLKELRHNFDMSDDERQLIKKLRTYLQHKRYLIIVDDIWSTTAWEHVKSALPENNLGSRIITTTRHADVAKSCSSFDGNIHIIQPLSEHDSQKLFYGRVFRSESPCPPQLKDVSQEIIKKCHGLPLALIAIASLLANKSDSNSWLQVKDSMAFVFTSQQVGDILLLSYYDLPYHLKACLLYFSTYPENYRIGKEEIIWRWIAEGFIPCVRGQTLVQTGESYFNDLINRGLIEPINIMYDGRAEACRVHDMMLDLIIFLSTEENFVTRFAGQESDCSSDNIRRLSLQSNNVGDKDMQVILDKCSRVRSLFSFHGLGKQAHFSMFRYLRVLVLEGNGHLGNDHVKCIGSIFQLKYLKINSKGITELPDQIGDLVYLQTLDMRSSSITILPPAIGRLRNLVRLLVDFDVELPNEIGDLQALQVLSRPYSFNSVNLVEHLRRLTNLKILHMEYINHEQGNPGTGKYRQDLLESTLALLGKHGLKSLEVDFWNYPRADKLLRLLSCDAPFLQILVICRSYINMLPQSISSLVNLAHLDVSVTSFKQEDIHILGGIRMLLYLRLQSRKAPGERLIISSQQFCGLKEFIFISHGEGALKIVTQPEAMPKLKILCLQFKANETKSNMDFEFSFEHLVSLEHLRVMMYCGSARTSGQAEAAIRETASINPGRPTVQISTTAWLSKAEAGPEIPPRFPRKKLQLLSMMNGIVDMWLSFPHQPTFRYSGHVGIAFLPWRSSLGLYDHHKRDVTVFGTSLY